MFVANRLGLMVWEHVQMRLPLILDDYSNFIVHFDSKSQFRRESESIFLNDGKHSGPI